MDRWVCSLPHGLEDDPFRALAIPFPVEDALPRAQVEGALRDGDNYLVADGERTQMRGRVVLPRPRIVAVRVRLPWSDTTLEPIEDIRP
jgi:hypothetical protein